MLLHYFYDPALAQASYLLACQACGEAVIIDPARDITPYLEAGARHNVRIAHVTETHIHADFVSGTREIAAATGARVYLSSYGDPDMGYDYADLAPVRLHDGDVIEIGRVKLHVLHTPGHTPEHLAFAWTDTAAANALGKTASPMGVITGDCIFVGDVGRPDLLETAVGIAGSSAAGARAQFQSVARFKAMPDHLQILPGHGAGSACGKALGAVPSSTLGYEKLYNPAFQFDDPDAFSAWLLDGQPEMPRYFARMKRMNRVGASLIARLPPIARGERFVLDEAVRAGASVIDARSAAEYAVAHIPGSLHIPPTEGFAGYAGWLIADDQPVYLVAHLHDLARLIAALRAVGVDAIMGCTTPDKLGDALVPTLQITPEDAAARLAAGDMLLLDVRNASERAEQHIAGSLHIHYGELAARIAELPDLPIMVHCAAGTRSLIAASVLERAGRTRIADVRGGIEAWAVAGLPLALK
jgi:hydroxyacylglutathione hydrolase